MKLVMWRSILSAKNVLGQAQRAGEDAHQVAGEALHLAIVGLPQRPHLRRPVGPEVGGEEAPALSAVVIRVVGVGVGPDDEALAPVRRALLLVHAVGGVLAADGHQPAIAVGRHLDPELLPVRQVEEGPRHDPHLVDLGLRHAVAGDDEEADGAAGLVHLGGDARLVLAPAGEKGRHIDYRNQRTCHRLRSAAWLFIAPSYQQLPGPRERAA